MPILTSLGSSSSRAYGQNGNIIIPGNSGIITSGSSYTLPYTTGFTINVLVIAGGGGGGGGSTRNAANAGYNVGAGGGGAGAAAYATNLSILPGQVVTFDIGGAGSAGSPRDGRYTSGSAGTSGSATVFYINGTSYATAGGGGPGQISPDSTAGSAGTVNVGSNALSAQAGGAGTSTNQFTGQGGYGAAGYTINTTVGLSIGSIIGYGSQGATYTAGGPSSTSGTVYGAGGGGGGTNQSDQQSPANAYPAAGTAGAVFIWWG